MFPQYYMSSNVISRFKTTHWCVTRKVNKDIVFHSDSFEVYSFVDAPVRDLQTTTSNKETCLQYFLELQKRTFQNFWKKMLHNDAFKSFKSFTIPV